MSMISGSSKDVLHFGTHLSSSVDLSFKTCFKYQPKISLEKSKEFTSPPDTHLLLGYFDFLYKKELNHIIFPQIIRKP